MVDMPRRSVARKRRLRHALYAAVAFILVVLASVGVTGLKPAAPGVDRSTIWTDTVKRGSMLREVRGTGTLVPEAVRVIASPIEGRVEQIHVQPGAQVTAGTVLMELSNAELEQAAVDAEFQVKAAEAELDSARARLASERMSQQSGVATVQAEYSQAKMQLDTDEALAREGLTSELTLRLARVKVQELANRLRVEQQRLTTTALSSSAQLAMQQARIEQVRAVSRLNHERVASLRVLAGTDGVLQQVSVEVGQQVSPGANLARVADPTTLKAELQIAETQAKDIQLGQPVVIDTRNGEIPGRVQRIDPAVQNGTVKVDVKFEGALPPGARPDLSVEGTVELERLDQVLYVGRPAGGAGPGTVGLFKLEDGGHTAVRVQVKLGRSSVNTVEVLEGLREGDAVILSDTSQWDGHERLEVK